MILSLTLILMLTCRQSISLILDQRYYCPGLAYCPEICDEVQADYQNGTCVECVCPKGYDESLDNYKLDWCVKDEDCASPKPQKVPSICYHGYCMCPKGSTILPEGKYCVKNPSEPRDQCIWQDRYMIECAPFRTTDYLEFELECNTDRGGTFYGRCTCGPGYFFESQDRVCDAITITKIGTKCRYHADCIMPFAWCVKNVCVCKDEFDEVPHGCQSKSRYCPPDSQTINEPTNSCEMYIENGTAHDNCANEAFCFTDGRTFSPESTKGRQIFVGHCCPNPPPEDGLGLACPHTRVAQGTKCPMSYGTKADRLGDCPTPENVCVGHKYRTDRACCPSACNHEQAINIWDKCLFPVPLGRPCQHELQCPDDSTCKPNAQTGDKICT